MLNQAIDSSVDIIYMYIEIILIHPKYKFICMKDCFNLLCYCVMSVIYYTSGK